MTTSTHPQKTTSRRDNDGLHRRRRIWYYSLAIDGERRFFSTRTRNYQEARNLRAAAIKHHVEGKLPNDYAKWLFEKLLPKVLEDRKLHLAETSRRLEHDLSKPLWKHFSGRRICEIDADAILAYQTSRTKQVSNRTTNMECNLLRHALKAAKVWAHVANDYKPLREDSPGPGRALEEHEEELLFTVARSKPGWDAAFYAALLASNTTMRGCELKGLRLSDVNLLDREIVVSRSKNDGGKGRRIPLNDAALWACARLSRRANALGSMEPGHFLFPGFGRQGTKATHGTGYDPTRHQKTWRTAWRSLCKEAARRSAEGIQGEIERERAMAPFIGLRFHDLRHCAITKLAESEASDQTIMSIAGHLNRKMLEYYSHIRNAAKRKAVEAMRGYIPEEPASASTTRV
jgi:integrase